MIIKGSEFHELVKLCQTSEKLHALEILKKKLNQLKNKTPFIDKKMKRILLTGSVIDDTEFLKFLEEKGFQIVADDLCIGSRYFWNIIDEDKDPIKAIA